MVSASVRADAHTVDLVLAGIRSPRGCIQRPRECGRCSVAGTREERWCIDARRPDLVATPGGGGGFCGPWSLGAGPSAPPFARGAPAPLRSEPSEVPPGLLVWSNSGRLRRRFRRLWTVHRCRIALGSTARREDPNPSLDRSSGARGLARGFGRLALSWPATSAGAASEPPTHNLKSKSSRVWVVQKYRWQVRTGQDMWGRGRRSEWRSGMR